MHQAACLGFQAFPQLTRATLTIEASRLLPPAEAPFFSQDLREIPPTLNEDLLDLYGRSEQVVANLFSFHNVSEALPGEFDWEMHESAAWRRELHSFDYALALAMTYRISQERRFAVHLRYLISHWIAQNPPGVSTGWEIVPLARRVRNWILAWDLAEPAWQDDLVFCKVFWQSLAMQIVFLRQYAAHADSLTGTLHCARALWLASRVFEKSAQDLAAAAHLLLAGVMESVFDHDVNTEIPRPIELYKLAEASVERLIFIPPAENADCMENVEATRKTLTFLEYALAPDGTLPMFGPAARSKVDELSDLYALAAVIFREPRWRTLAGKFGILPYLILGERGKLEFEQMVEAPRDSPPREIPELGLFRLGSANRSALIINARPSTDAGDHQDFWSYELHVEGLRVVVDSGPYSPAGESWCKYFSSEYAHNVLLVDGQAPRFGRAEQHLGESTLSLDNSICLTEATFDSPRIRHHRAFFNLNGQAWAVVDWLTGAGRHKITSLIHLFPTFQVKMAADRAVANSRALSVTIFPLPVAPGSSQSVLRAWRGPGTQNQGFYSPDFGVKFPAAVLALSAEEIDLPWIGGYVIARGTGQEFLAREADPVEGRLALELSGKTFRLGFRGRNFWSGD